MEPKRSSFIPVSLGTDKLWIRKSMIESYKINERSSIRFEVMVLFKDVWYVVQVTSSREGAEEWIEENC